MEIFPSTWRTVVGRGRRHRASKGAAPGGAKQGVNRCLHGRSFAVNGPRVGNVFLRLPADCQETFSVPGMTPPRGVRGRVARDRPGLLAVTIEAAFVCANSCANKGLNSSIRGPEEHKAFRRRPCESSS